MNEPTLTEIKSPKFNTTALKATLINFIVPLICLAASIALIATYIYPSVSKYQELKQSLEQSKEKVRVLSEKEIRLNKLVDFSNVVAEDSTQVDLLLESEANVPRLLDEIHQIATDAGIAVEKLSYSYGPAGTGGTPAAAPVDPSAVAKDYSVVNVSLGGTSNYDQMIVFLQNLEKAARVVNVSNYRFSMDTSEDITQLTSNFSLDSPYMYVQSNAVTDDPVMLDITSDSFVTFMNKIKNFRYYEFTNSVIPVVDEAEESTPSTPLSEGAETEGETETQTPQE